MTPKQKAKEMIEESTKLGNSYCAKRHCIWLCDEMLLELEDIEDGYRMDRVEYWQEVKQEIKNERD